MYQKVSSKRYHKPIPQSIQNLPGIIVCQKAYTKKWNKLLINRQSHPRRGIVPIRRSDSWKSLKYIRILLEKPAKTNDFFHIMEYE